MRTGKKRPTFAELLGFKAITGQDTTGNETFTPASVPPQHLREVGRTMTLDDQSPTLKQDLGDNTDPGFVNDPEDDALPEDVEEAQFANSQLDLTEDMPSTTNVKRFVNQ